MHPSHPGNDQHQFPPLMLMRDEQIVEVEPPEDMDAVADFQSKLTERYVAESIRFIDEHRDEPFFLYLPHMYVHVPHYAPREYVDRSANGAYGAVVEHLDWSVGEILNALDERELGENTLVLFTSGELYDLDADVGETTDVAAAQPDVTARLQALAEACRKDLGDDRTGVSGANCRPAGKVEHPETILPRHPLAEAEYD